MNINVVDLSDRRARVKEALKALLEEKTIRFICQMGTIRAQQHAHGLMMQGIYQDLRDTALQYTLADLDKANTERSSLLQKPRMWNVILQDGLNGYVSWVAERFVAKEIEESWDVELEKHMLMVDIEVAIAIFPQVLDRSKEKMYEHQTARRCTAESSSPATTEPVQPAHAPAKPSTTTLQDSRTESTQTALRSFRSHQTSQASTATATAPPASPNTPLRPTWSPITPVGPTWSPLTPRRQDDK